MLTALGGASGILKSGNSNVAEWENLERRLDRLAGPIQAANNAGVGVKNILNGAGGADEYIESGSELASDDEN